MYHEIIPLELKIIGYHAILHDQGEDEPKANGAPEEQKASNPEKDALLTYIKSMEE